MMLYFCIIMYACISMVCITQYILKTSHSQDRYSNCMSACQYLLST